MALTVSYQVVPTAPGNMCTYVRTVRDSIGPCKLGL